MSSKDESTGLLTSATLTIILILVLSCVATFGWQVLAGDGAQADHVNARHRSTSTSSESASPAPTSTPSGASTNQEAEITSLLARVTIVAERPQVPGYERDCGPEEGCVFGTEWTDATNAPDGHNGCDTRNDVLAQSLANVTFSARSPDCDVVGGILTDPYTGAVMDYATDGSEIHIDHLFPLAAAWDLGAASWSLERRTEFANDTAVELIAVQGTANMSKGDSTPASWLPPQRAFRCDYVARYLSVAIVYDLAVTAADETAIGHVADSC